MTIEIASPAETADQWPRTPDEFERRVVSLQDGLVHFACCRLDNLQDAEDVVQDVLVQAWKQRAALASVTRFTPYVYRMTANRCTDLMRRRSRLVPFSPLGTTAPVDHSLDELVDMLPAEQAEVLRLHVWTGLTFAEIAEVTRSSAPTAKSRFRYALERLRRLLTPQGEAS